MSITIKDVAAQAGVSAQAVSLVLNGKSAGQLSRATCEKVMQAVEELGYCRNASAGALRGVDTRTTAVLSSMCLATMIDEHRIAIVMNLLSLMNSLNYACFFSELNEPDKGHLQKIRDLLSRGVRRFIIIGSIWSDAEISKLLKKNNARCFRINDSSADNVCFSYKTAFAELWKVLSPEERSSMKLVLNEKNQSSASRLEGLAQLPGEQGKYIFSYPFKSSTGAEGRRQRAEQGWDAMRSLMEKHPETKMALFYSDHYMVGAVQYCCDNGIRIGEDVRLGCINCTRYTETLPFPLLTFRHPVEKVMEEIKCWLEGQEQISFAIEMQLCRNPAAARAGLFPGVPQAIL